VKDTLKGVYLERGAFQEKEKKATAELKNLSLAYAEVQTQARADREVLQQMKQIAAGKPFFASVCFWPQGVHRAHPCMVIHRGFRGPHEERFRRGR
jgi:hypothetical protein